MSAPARARRRVSSGNSTSKQIKRESFTPQISTIEKSETPEVNVESSQSPHSWVFWCLRTEVPLLSISTAWILLSRAKDMTTAMLKRLQRLQISISSSSVNSRGGLSPYPEKNSSLHTTKSHSFLSNACVNKESGEAGDGGDDSE